MPVNVSPAVSSGSDPVASIPASASVSSPITYNYLASEKKLTAILNGETFVLIDLITPSPSNLFIDVETTTENPAAEFLRSYEMGIASIEQVGDFDRDGIDDALVGFSHGGNCCAPGYAIISVLNDGSFRLSPIIDWAWNPPQTIIYNNKLAFETRTDNQIYVHSYENGRVVLLDERIIQEREAIAQLRVDEVIAGTVVPSLGIDINNDGVMETLNCEVWDRWQTLLCQIDNADGTVLQDFGQGCDRYGILPTITNGIHDIVCNEQTIARRDGTEYIWD
ncbi:MAG: hypothetical protein AAGD25_38000 [Cyanobacteria bacterium P01_F01_bin.150]